MATPKTPSKTDAKAHEAEAAEEPNIGADQPMTLADVERLVDVRAAHFERRVKTLVDGMLSVLTLAQLNTEQHAAIDKLRESLG